MPRWSRNLLVLRSDWRSEHNSRLNDTRYGPVDSDWPHHSSSYARFAAPRISVPATPVAPPSTSAPTNTPVSAAPSPHVMFCTEYGEFVDNDVDSYSNSNCLEAGIAVGRPKPPKQELQSEDPSLPAQIGICSIIAVTDASALDQKDMICFVQLRRLTAN